MDRIYLERCIGCPCEAMDDQARLLVAGNPEEEAQLDAAIQERRRRCVSIMGGGIVTLASGKEACRLENGAPSSNLVMEAEETFAHFART